jgi:hypothetical protein
MSVPNTFASATSAIPLSNLDADFAYYDAAFQIVGGAMEVNYTFRLEDPVDITKKAEFVMSGITTGTTRQYTMPNISGTLAVLANTSQTFTGTTAFIPASTGSALTFGSTNGTGAVTLGQSTVTQIVNVGTGATTAVSTKTVNIGTTGVSGSTTNINLGSAVSGSLGTITLNSNTTFGTGYAVTFSAGTANGVPYLNGSKVLTTGTALTFDGTKLGVNTSSLGAAPVFIRLANTAARAANQGATIGFWPNSDFAGAAEGAYISGVETSGTVTNSVSLIFGTGTGGTATEKMRLDSAGNLGIGTTTTTNKLNVQGNASVSNGSWFGFGDAEERIRGDNAGIMQFFTGGSERVRIDASGNLLVGTTATYGGPGRINVGFNQSTNFGVTVRNTNATATGVFISFENSAGGGNGSISQVNSSAILYNTSSDYRLKNITGPITTSGAYIDSLKPVEGTWKADGSTFVGLIAHETQEASRTTVATGTKDGAEMQGMDYSSAEIIANLIAELQSLRARVAQLESK